jgi:serine/threonine protein kinase
MGGHVKLCDFGFAARVSSSSLIDSNGGSGGKSGSDGDTALVDGCGTAMYVAPEIAEGFMKRPHGFPVDWWGLGCVLFEMITGE